ncbi:RNA methyltransferase [Fibrella sp. HMF5335]|uniref:RNA methyltransferase n=1 Tax=Fibrella rubiginis TaxID=2817060 RepID=A0A939GJW4_9BACT|nr:RNA methyltransferase [Fibrella rubiginis]MBO0938780.1 RNA methyltransferase [Fibrella rubiginis]
MQVFNLPAAFEAQMQQQLGPDYPAFVAALATPPPVSIRLNPRKPGFNTAGLTPVPWCETGVYLSERPVFTLDPLFQAGAYYVQEASSMLLAEAIRQTVGQTRAYVGRPPVRALDLCAAPGGKSTLMASTLPPNSVLVCNEVIRSRVPVLRENIDKWGYANVVVSHHDPEDFAPLAGFFDLVMIDAPCSGEGLFRKDPKAVGEWSPEHVQLCSARQGRILAASAPLVAEDGWLIYSTCTYNDAENGLAVQWLSDHGFQNHPLNLPPDSASAWGITERVFGNSVGYQCYPHRVRGEGFFISLFRKTGSAASPVAKTRGFKSARLVHHKQVGALKPFLRHADQFSFWQKPNDEILAVPIALEKELVMLDGALRSKGFGIEMGLFKGQDFLPNHALALSTELAPDLPGVDLTREESLHYFKKENLLLPGAPRGWLLARYEGLPLGWMKNLGNRVNNYLPKDWRIRMDIPEYT